MLACFGGAAAPQQPLESPCNTSTPFSDALFACCPAVQRDYYYSSGGVVADSGDGIRDNTTPKCEWAAPRCRLDPTPRDVPVEGPFSSLTAVASAGAGDHRAAGDRRAQLCQYMRLPAQRAGLIVLARPSAHAPPHPPTPPPPPPPPPTPPHTHPHHTHTPPLAQTAASAACRTRRCLSTPAPTARPSGSVWTWARSTSCSSAAVGD